MTQKRLLMTLLYSLTILRRPTSGFVVFSPNAMRMEWCSQFGSESVEFAGFKITIEGTQPMDKYVEAIGASQNPETLGTCVAGTVSSTRWPIAL
jgi:hypothetical protein